MKTVHLTRVYHFCAGHRLFHPGHDGAWNDRVFGKCSLPGGHGHNYRLEVTVRGAPDPEAGWVVPAAALDGVVAREVMERIDHRDLNDSVPLRFGPAPTTEVLVLEIWELLARRIPPPASLHKLRISETEKNTFEYFGPRPRA